jgi:hypothetical protein
MNSSKLAEGRRFPKSSPSAPNDQRLQPVTTTKKGNQQKLLVKKKK